MDKNECVGRLIAYGFGTAIGLVSISSKAEVNPAKAPEVISLLQLPLPIPHVEITLADITTLLGAFAIVVRLRWDYNDRKRRGK
ncbi:MAG: hypothetical protein ACRC48_06780 [Aeromonas veronii]